MVPRGSTALNVSDVIERVRISSVAEALGIKLDRTRRRGVATWREGRNFSVSFDDAKNVWHDFVTGEGGGVIALVQLIVGCDRKAALRWLAGFAGVPLGEQTDSERRNWSQRMRAVEPKARKLVAWKYETIEALREQRNLLQRTYHRAVNFIVNHDVEECERRGDLRFELALTIGWTYWERVEKLDAQIDALQAAAYTDLLARF